MKSIARSHCQAGLRRPPDAISIESKSCQMHMLAYECMETSFLFTHPSICPSTRPSICSASIQPPSIHRFVHLCSLHPATGPSICSPFIQPLLPATRPAIIHPHTSICPYVHPPVVVDVSMHFCTPRNLHRHLHEIDVFKKLQSGPRQQHSIKTHKLHHNQYS